MVSKATKSAPGIAGRSRIEAQVERQISRLDDLGVGALRAHWRQRFRSEPPPIQSADILRRLIAWKIQAKIFGDLDPATKRYLQDGARALSKGRTVAPAPKSQLQAGMVLVRDWRGTERRVLVLDDAFEYESKRYPNLTQVARAITGTHWSGPRFFGLTGNRELPGKTLEKPK